MPQTASKPPSSTLDAPQTTLALISVAGPRVINHTLTPPGPVTLGRRAGNTLQLLEKDSVSREHAMLVTDTPRQPKNPDTSAFHPTTGGASGVGGGGGWFLVDRGSRHGTRLNGIKLKPDQRYPIEPDDLIEMAPWVFQVVNPALRGTDSRLSQTFDDTTHSSNGNITLVEPAAANKSTGQWMNLLLDCAESIHDADTEVQLATSVLEAAIRGTGYTNAAILRPMTDDANVTVLAAHGSFTSQADGPSFSRSLIRRAAVEGLPTRLTRQQSDPDLAVSVFELGIDEALCVPLKLGPTVAGFLYLDNRHGTGRAAKLSTDATQFAVRLAQIAALALSNLMRLDLQKRYARVESDLAAAAEAQAFVLPQRTGSISGITYTGESRPGRVISGDFFDVIPLNEQRLAITLGDVAGKGVAASVLMTAAQGYIHAAFSHTHDPAKVVTALNTFLQARCADSRFITLWAAVIDIQQRTLTYVDAGHGYALLRRPEGELLTLADRGGPPIGIASSFDYPAATLELYPGGSLLIVSDGMVEQQAQPDDEGRAEEFGFPRIQSIINQLPPQTCPVQTLFTAIEQHAGRTQLADDATAVALQWA
ncbi:MAG: SpoIIE family protein phosphatase [Phycisphaeraceae bacterium]